MWRRQLGETGAGIGCSRQGEKGFADLETQSLRLDELDRDTVDLDEALALLNESDGNCLALQVGNQG